MKKLITIFSLFTLVAFCGQPIATLTLSWTPGDNPTGTQHIILGGIVSGNYTFTNTVPYTQTTCIISNLTSGTRYYFVVVETDGQSFSDYSNEANGKPKLNKATNLTITAP